MSLNVISPDDLRRGLMDQDTAQNKDKISGALSVYKEWGKTPLQSLDSLRVDFPILKHATLSYAGRLDPLAEGLMLVLVGDANKQREEYLGLDKTYEVEVLLGISTDTGDLFGVPTVAPNSASINYPHEADLKFKSTSAEEVLKSLVGKQSFPYPAYSSKTVRGKPLHQWASEGRIGEIEIPKTDVEIYSLEEASGPDVRRSASISEIRNKVEAALATVSGDFRLEEIGAGWLRLLGSFGNSEREETARDDGPPAGIEASFPILKITCSCSSGTYMRTLAEEIGRLYGLPALAYSIRRIKVGNIAISERVIGAASS